MKKRVLWMIALLCASPFGGWGAGAWAQDNPTTVSSEDNLTAAINRGDANIQLTGNILLSNYLNINGKTVTIDLNGHKLYRNHTNHNREGHVIYVQGNSNLTLKSSTGYGYIEGGKANNGGAINIPHGNTVSATKVIFQNNSAANHAGAVWNNGTFTATSCTFTNNRANDVGAIYNAVQTESNVTYAGTATLTNCNFTGNAGTAGAGALANAKGATVMTIDGGSITGNTADTYGAGIWNGGTLNMKGAITVQNNTNVSGMVSNVYLKSGKVITVTSSLEGSHIGVDMESTSGTFTSGYNTYNSSIAPSTIFTADLSIMASLGLDNNGEARLTATGSVYYIEREWNNNKVVNIERVLTGSKIAYNAKPTEGQYKEVTTENGSWFGMGSYSSIVPEYYVVRETVNLETIVVQGSNVHLILCNGATLTLTGGLKLEGNNKLYIHSQSYGGAMGRLIVTNRYENAAGIGSALDKGAEKTVGKLVIYGGHIEATGGKYGAGIGSCKRTSKDVALCDSVTVYGGYVKATGGEGGAGIGGGGFDDTNGIAGGQFILYDGTVIAKGGEEGSGVGGGGYGDGGIVTIIGGSLTATGGRLGSGIGGGNYKRYDSVRRLSGGTFRIYGGTVTAQGGDYASGIGGGYYGAGAVEVTINGGMVTATGGDSGSGIGGGYYSIGGNVTIYSGTVTATGDSAPGIGGGYDHAGGTVNISGGTVTATGGEYAAGIGGGRDGKGGDVTITGGTVIARAGDQGGEGNRAIGPGREKNIYGTLTIGDTMMVGAGNNGSVERIYNADERVNACWYRSYAEISPCTHPNATYTVSGTDANGTHTKHCSHCTTTFEAEPHDFNGTDECTVCHLKSTVYTVTIYLPDAKDDDTYTTDGKYKTYTYNMVAGTSFTLPGAPQDLYDMEFAGWLVITTEGEPSFATYKASADETLLAEKTEYTLENSVKFVARYKDIAISLADVIDDSEKLYTYNGRKAASVTLTGRKLYKDGNWNTLCLPFSLTATQVSERLNPAALMELDTVAGTYDHITGFEDGTLYLNFKTATSIVAGKPYIIKWANLGGYIVNPAFSNITISDSIINVNSADSTVTFVGTYSPLVYTDTVQSVLFLGTGNELYYPKPTLTDPDVAYNAETNPYVPATIGAFRAYFQLNGITAGEPNDQSPVRQFVLSFGGEETGILSTTNFMNSGAWYGLDGRRLNGKPSRAGVYIKNGKKVVIK